MSEKKSLRLPGEGVEQERLLHHIEEVSEVSPSVSTPATPSGKETRKVNRFTLEIDHNSVLNNPSQNGTTPQPTSSSHLIPPSISVTGSPKHPPSINTDLSNISRNNSTSRFLGLHLAQEIFFVSFSR